MVNRLIYAGKIVNVRHIHGVVSAIDGWYRERDLFGRVSLLISL